MSRIALDVLRLYIPFEILKNPRYKKAQAFLDLRLVKSLAELWTALEASWQLGLRQKLINADAVLRDSARSSSLALLSSLTFRQTSFVARDSVWL